MDLPPELREEQYDAVLVYSNHLDDVQLACLAKQFIEKHVPHLEDGARPRVCVFDSADLLYINGRFNQLAEAVRRSTYMFLLLTRHFASDTWCELAKDGCLEEVIENPSKRWCLIPLYACAKSDLDFEIPMFLRSLRGIHMNTFVHDTKYFTRVDVESLHGSQLNFKAIGMLQKLFNIRLSMKNERQSSQHLKIQEWRAQHPHDNLKISDANKKRAVENTISRVNSHENGANASARNQPFITNPTETSHNNHPLALYSGNVDQSLESPCKPTQPIAPSQQTGFQSTDQVSGAMNNLNISAGQTVSYEDNCVLSIDATPCTDDTLHNHRNDFYVPMTSHVTSHMSSYPPSVRMRDEAHSDMDIDVDGVHDSVSSSNSTNEQSHDTIPKTPSTAQMCPTSVNPLALGPEHETVPKTLGLPESNVHVAASDLGRSRTTETTDLGYHGSEVFETASQQSRGTGLVQAPELRNYDNNKPEVAFQPEAAYQLNHSSDIAHRMITNPTEHNNDSARASKKPYVIQHVFSFQQKKYSDDDVQKASHEPGESGSPSTQHPKQYVQTPDIELDLLQGHRGPRILSRDQLSVLSHGQCVIGKGGFSTVYKVPIKDKFFAKKKKVPTATLR